MSLRATALIHHLSLKKNSQRKKRRVPTCTPDLLACRKCELGQEKKHPPLCLSEFRIPHAHARMTLLCLCSHLSVQIGTADRLATFPLKKISQIQSSHSFPAPTEPIFTEGVLASNRTTSLNKVAADLFHELGPNSRVFLEPNSRVCTTISHCRNYNRKYVKKCFFWVLRRKRRDFSQTRAHYQCWFVYDLKIHEKRCKNKSTPLSHTLRRHQRIETSRPPKNVLALPPGMGTTVRQGPQSSQKVMQWEGLGVSKPRLPAILPHCPRCPFAAVCGHRLCVWAPPNGPCKQQFNLYNHFSNILPMAHAAQHGATESNDVWSHRASSAPDCCRERAFRNTRKRLSPSFESSEASSRSIPLQLRESWKEEEDTLPTISHLSKPCGL